MLAATVLGSGIAALDATVVGIALPAIGRDFHASVASMQWVVDGYTLPLAGLLLLGGALGDVVRPAEGLRDRHRVVRARVARLRPGAGRRSS